MAHNTDLLMEKEIVTAKTVPKVTPFLIISTLVIINLLTFVALFYHLNRIPRVSIATWFPKERSTSAGKKVNHFTTGIP